MSIQTARANLADAMKKLDHAWQQAREDWRDQVAARFEAERIEPLMDVTRSAISGIGPLEETIRKARHACGSEE